MNNINQNIYTRFNRTNLFILLVSIFTLTGFFISCDTAATEKTTEETTKEPKNENPKTTEEPKNENLKTRAYFVTDSSNSATGSPNWYTKLGVTTDATGSFSAGYDWNGTPTLTSTTIDTGGADGTSKYLTLAGGGVTGASGGWDIDGTTTAGTDFSGAGYVTLAFWAKAALANALHWTLKDTAGTEAGLAINISSTWTEYKIPLSDFAPIDLTKINELSYVVPDNDQNIDIDEVYLSKTTTTTTLPIASADPTETTVLVVYSDAYTTGTAGVTIATGVNMNDAWETGREIAGPGSAFATEVSLGGNNAYKYTGISSRWIGLSSLDVQNYTNIHLDIWTDSDTSGLMQTRITLHSAAFFGTSFSEGESYIDVQLTMGGWTSVDIPLANLTVESGTLDFSGLSSLKITPASLDPPILGKTIYVDNIYFY